MDGQPYLLAHACTAESGKWKLDQYHLMGDLWYKVFLHEGVSGYISICGHRNTEDGSGKTKREMSICATADVDLSMDGWDVYAWKRRKLFMRDGRRNKR